MKYKKPMSAKTRMFYILLVKVNGLRECLILKDKLISKLPCCTDGVWIYSVENLNIVYVKFIQLLIILFAKNVY